MKETQLINQDIIKFEKQAEVNIKESYIGSVRKTKGLVVYEVDLINKTIQQAVFQSAHVHIAASNSENKIISNLLVKDKHFYVEALNIKNAKRKVFAKFGIHITN